ncbi:DUF1854 domain-containing protein [Cohnella caldifontis]|uniref:DUF1854 domain-containing protein n=1 Tax=Cohnella caldifontis TaxID=3027471 RepID=UPI0023EA8BC6|nr:DUF1854 domain-containing protein [Cohnella sp. YIM B05605]
MTENGGLPWIETRSVRFERDGQGYLIAEWLGRRERVTASRLFPLTHPDGYIAVQDSSGRPLGVLRSLEGMEAGSRTAVEREAGFRPFLPRIVSIRRIRRRFGHWHWDVLTDAGPMRIRTGPFYESIAKLEGGLRLVTDVTDQKYGLPAESEWDARSRKMLAKWL